MNAGIIASRYARALLQYVQDSGGGDKVYSQACVIGLRMMEVRELKDFLEDHGELSVERKLELLQSSLGEEPAPELVAFVNLVASRRRMRFFSRILYSFIAQYREANNIKVGRIIVASPVDGLKERIEALFHERTGAQIQLLEKVNPEILGGFIFEMDGYRLDASVENQFRRIRRQLIEKNNRIV